MIGTKWTDYRKGQTVLAFLQFRLQMDGFQKNPLTLNKYLTELLLKQTPKGFDRPFLYLYQIINDAGERENYIGMEASFCSVSGNIWLLSTDEFWNNSYRSYQYDTCHVRCLKD